MFISPQMSDHDYYDFLYLYAKFFTREVFSHSSTEDSHLCSIVPHGRFATWQNPVAKNHETFSAERTCQSSCVSYCQLLHSLMHDALSFVVERDKGRSQYAQYAYMHS